MIKKTISYRSSYLLDGLIKADKKFFSISDAAELLSKENTSTVRELLRAMTERGLIMRIKDGLYHLVPYEVDSKNYFPNWHLVAEAIAGKKEYYIGFYSALDIHGLITQPSLVEQIVVHERIKPKSITSQKVKFEIITYNQKHFFGHKNTWIDDYNKVMCSDIEKTIIDSLYKPEYSGGISEVTKALYKGIEKINSEKLLSYLDKFDAQVVYKRLGYLLDNMNLLPEIHKSLQKRIRNSYTYLDQSLQKQGKHISKWKIIDNINVEEAINGLGT